MSSVDLKGVLDFFLGEISEFRTQFARLTRIDIQFVSLSKFDIEHMNFLGLGVSHLFSSISLFSIFFLNTRPWEKTIMPLCLIPSCESTLLVSCSSPLFCSCPLSLIHTSASPLTSIATSQQLGQGLARPGRPGAKAGGVQGLARRAASRGCLQERGASSGGGRRWFVGLMGSMAPSPALALAVRELPCPQPCRARRSPATCGDGGRAQRRFH